MMTISNLDWETIRSVGRSLGVGEKALEKWKERQSIPHKWRLAIIRQFHGKLALDALDKFPAEEARK